MREPERNKVTRFPHRIGNKVITCRDLTREEIEARGAEKAAVKKAREFRRRKQRERDAAER